MPSPALIAFDRMSVRTVDADGNLHISRSNISKANVCPYLGREIPNADALGLSPERIYHLYRDPAELAAAAASFENKPLTLTHVIHSATDPKHESIVGTVSAVQFEAPYLTASLAVWTAEAKALVESGMLEQISCAYRYQADMTPGEVDGVAYDGIMRDIVCNHVALVEQGRAGPDVVVADSFPLELVPMKSKFLKILLPLLTVTAEQALALDAALKDDLAAEDANLTDEEKKAAVDAALKELGKDALTEEEETEAYKRAAKDKKARDAAPEAPEGGAPKPAQDGKLFTQADLDSAVSAARTDATASAKLEMSALHKALGDVRPVVGDVTCDSAGDAYKLALTKLNVDLAGVPVEAYPAMFALASKVQAAPAPVAQNSVAALDKALREFSHIRLA